VTNFEVYVLPVNIFEEIFSSMFLTM